MWKDYSLSYLKNNRASSVSIMVAAFIATLFLALLCSLFYNFWTYEVEQIILDEGSWQARITGELDEADLAAIQNFGNVERVTVNQKLSRDGTVAADITFHNIRTVYHDVPLIAEQFGPDRVSLDYHELLLSRYLVHDPQDKEPPLLVAFYLAILLVVSLSLILIIHNSFAVSMNARIHQFGIFSSIGATPGQIRTALVGEALMLCAVPVLTGCLLGTGLSFGAIQAVNTMAESAAGRHEAVFQFSAVVFAGSVALAFLTILISAWIPARRLSKMTPLQAIWNTDEPKIRKRRKAPVLSSLFGIEGELAGNALKAQRKALRTSTLSLTLSFLGFTAMLCFLTLAAISTDHTYFEKYQDAWDVMATVKDTPVSDLGQAGEIRDLQGVESCVVYQKAQAAARISKPGISGAVKAKGGLEAVTGGDVTADADNYLVEAPIVIMDDQSFLQYCEQTGAAPGLDGAIALNRVWDTAGSNFRYKEYLPLVDEGQDKIVLQSAEQAENTAEIPVLAYAQEAPALREEYDGHAFVQFMPVSLWNKISGQIGAADKDSHIRILAEEATLAALNDIESSVGTVIGQEYTLETENRVQERITNDSMIRGYMLVTGALCSLLAVIGIANVFSNTMGFLRQRKREFARYMSVGMTPSGMKKMFCIEVLVIAGRPVLITLPLTAAAVAFMIRASYLDPAEFLVQAPFVPVLVFILAIFGFVALAYYLGGRKILQADLVDALRSDMAE